MRRTSRIGRTHSSASCFALVVSHSSAETMTSRMIPALTVFLGALVVARSQQSDVEVALCATSSLEGFEFQAEPESGFALYWNLSADLEEVSFKVMIDARIPGWMSVGFSSDGDMIGSDAVVGFPGQDEVLEYELGSKSAVIQPPTSLIEPSIREYADQEITFAAVERSATTTSLAFTRPTSPTTAGKLPLLTGASDSVILIWAFGQEDTFGYHSDGRGAFTVDLFCAEAVSSSPSSPSSPSSTTDVSEPVVGTEVPAAGTDAPTASPETLVFSVSPTVAPVSTTIGAFAQSVPASTNGGSRLQRGGVFGLGGGGSGASVSLAVVVFGLSVAWLVTV